MNQETHGVIVISDERFAQDAAELAHRTGWPIIAEPAANVRSTNVVAHSPLFLTSDFIAAHVPDVAVTFGRFGLSRPVTALVRGAARHIAVSHTGLIDPLGTGETTTVVPDITVVAAGDWLEDFRRASNQASVEVRELTQWSSLTAVATIGSLVTADDCVLIAASRAVRDAEMMWSSCDARVFMNRGANGIDGLVSTAWGIAVGTRRHTVAVVGDLAFLHDINGLLGRDGHTEPDLTFVVLNNNGGAIFSSLEQGRGEHAQHFEQVFGTPHNVDLVAVASNYAQTIGVRSVHELKDALPGAGVRIIVADLGSREDEQRQLDELKAAAAEAVNAAL